MSLASHANYPSGGRLGRRSRTMSQLVMSSILAVAVLAIAVGLITLAARGNRVSSRSPSPVAKAAYNPPKILQSAHSARDRVQPVAPVVAAPLPSAAVAVSPAPSDAVVQPNAPPIPAAKLSAAPAPTKPAKPGENASGAVGASVAGVPQPAAPVVAAPSPRPANATVSAPAQTVPQSAAFDSIIPTAPARRPRASEPDSSTAAKPAAEDATPAPVNRAQPAPQPARVEPPAAPRAVAPVAPRDNAAPGNAAAASGPQSFAAYISTAPTQAAAWKELVPLQRKYAAALGGRHLSWHRMRAGGKTVYRVRVAGLDQADAAALCQKFTSAGEACKVGAE